MGNAYGFPIRILVVTFEATPLTLGVAFTMKTLTERQSLSARKAAKPPPVRDYPFPVLNFRSVVRASLDFQIKRHQQHWIAALRVVHERHEAQRAARVFGQRCHHGALLGRLRARFIAFLVEELL